LKNSEESKALGVSERAKLWPLACGSLVVGVSNHVTQTEESVEFLNHLEDYLS
jgi:hypothetical protein